MGKVLNEEKLENVSGGISADELKCSTCNIALKTGYGSDSYHDVYICPKCNMKYYHIFYSGSLIAVGYDIPVEKPDLEEEQKPLIR